MVIYAEYLFMQNGVAGFMILLLTRRICGFSSSWQRILLGSVLCGLYAFILLWEDLLWCWAILFKITFSVGIVILTFPAVRQKNIARGVLVFYLISFAMGGIVVGSMYMFNSTGITSGGAFYIGQITYIRVLLGMALAWIGLYIFSVLIKDRIKKGRTEAELKVGLGDRQLTLKGFVDTGNFLRDPISGRPVCVVTKKVLEELAPDAAQFCIVPYRSVGRKEGLMRGIRPDSAFLVDSNKKHQAVDVILAVSEAELPTGQDGQEYEVILHEALAGGGILQNE